MSNANEALFERTPIPAAIRTLMLPTIFGSLVMVLYSLADTLFVGMLHDEVQSAAVSLAAPALLAFNAVNNLFGVGASSMMSRALGRKEYHNVRASASFGFYGSLICGVLLSVFCGAFLQPLMVMLGALPDTIEATGNYMRWAVVWGAAPSILNVVLGYLVRAEGAALHASIGTMSGCVLNMILDPICILPWGLGMGAAGAGFATFISNCFACGYFLVLLLVQKDRTNIKLSPKYFRPTKQIVLGVCGVGIPAAIQNLLNVTGMTILNNFIKGYGASAMAAVGIAQKIYMVPVQIALGGTQGVMPLVGYSYSAHNTQRFRDSIRFVLKLLLPAIVLICAACWIFARPLIGMFLNTPEVVDYGVLFLRGFVCSLPFMIVDFMAVGVFQSVGMGKKSLIFAILRKIVLEIPAIIVLNAIFHASGITYAAMVAESVLAVAGVSQMRKITAGMEAEQV